MTVEPMWGLWLALLALGTALAMVGTVAVRRLVPLDHLRRNNEVAGFKFATVGVLYAVLLAFAVLVVWEKDNDAEASVAAEAGSAAALYRLSGGLGPDAAALRAAISAYLEAAVRDEWPAMARGEESRAALDALDVLYAAVLAHAPADARGTVVQAEALRQLDQLTEARQARVVVAAGVVPGVIWAVLFVGGAITIGFTFFFGTDNLRAQALMTGALALLILLGLLVIVAIDRPFAGSVRLEAEPLLQVLEDFGDERVGSLPDR
jgi:hypothetical protein